MTSNALRLQRLQTRALLEAPPSSGNSASSSVGCVRSST